MLLMFGRARYHTSMYMAYFTDNSKKSTFLLRAYGKLPKTVLHFELPFNFSRLVVYTVYTLLIKVEIILHKNKIFDARADSRE